MCVSVCVLLNIAQVLCRPVRSSSTRTPARELRQFQFTSRFKTKCDRVTYANFERVITHKVCYHAWALRKIDQNEDVGNK